MDAGSPQLQPGLTGSGRCGVVVVSLAMGDRAGAVLQAWRTWLVQNNSDITVALLLVLGARRLATRSPFRTAISLTRVAPKPVPGCGAASPGNPDILDGGSPGTGEARRGRG